MPAKPHEPKRVKQGSSPCCSLGGCSKSRSSRVRQGKAEAGVGGCHSPSALSPSLPAWYPRVAAGIWELLQPVELVLEAHNNAVAGNPVTSSQPQGGELSYNQRGRCWGRQSNCPHPGCSNLGKTHTGWEGSTGR